MSYEEFVDNIISKLKIKVVETVNKKISKSCSSSTISTQTKKVKIMGVTSHFTDDYKYDPNIDCSSNVGICSNFPSMVCSRETKKCVPACKISVSQNQDVNVNVNCVGEQQQLISSSKTSLTDLKSGGKNVSQGNLDIQNSIYESLENVLGNTDTNLIQKINTIFIESISDTEITQKCSSNVLVVQDQNLLISGDIYCTPYSSININQDTNINNFINCVFSDAKNKLLQSEDVAQAYNNSKNTQCICDKKYIGNCDPNTNTRKVSYSIIKPSTGNGSCNCPVNTTTEPCELKYNLSYQECIPGDWSNWTDCKDGFQSRTRDIVFGNPDCVVTSEKRPCNITFDIIKNSFMIQVKRLYKVLIMIISFILILIFIWLL